MSEYVGKFVCYDRADGGACWGRIKEEAYVNTMEGEKEVFILDRRYNRYRRTKDLRRFRQFFPGMSSVGCDPGMSSAGSTVEGEELFLEVRRIKGDTILHKDAIDLERDIVDIDDMLKEVDEEELFKAVLNVSCRKEIRGKDAFEIGVQALLNDPSLSDEAKRDLKKRME